MDGAAGWPDRTGSARMPEGQRPLRRLGRNRMIRRRTTLALPALLGVAHACPASAQPAWPSRPIRMVIPWPPGQATDIMGRIVAQRLSERLGQVVVPENRPGAGGQIGTDAVAKAAPDGHTLLSASIGPITFSPLVQRTPY